MRVAISGVFVLLIAGAALAQSEVPVLQQWTGDHSNITSQEFHRITGVRDWRALWARHSSDPVPAVNFNKYMVIASFFGETTEWTGTTEQLGSIVRNRTTITVTYTKTYGDAAFQNPPTFTRYSILVVPRSRDRILILEHSLYFGGFTSDEVLADIPRLRR
jgi:hypothetical protein